VAQDLIGRFRIEEVKRRVGRGVSYLAEDPQHGGTVLLRVFPPLGTEGTEWVERIRLLMNQFRHLRDVPFVNFSEIGVVDQLTYLSRPFLAGTTLAELRAGQLGVSDIVDIGCRVSDAVAKMHAVGVVHGSLHPSNIVLLGDDVRVVDFGLAFLEPHPPDYQKDLAALGSMLYGLFTGTSPAPGARPSNPSVLNPDVSTAAGALVDDLLSGRVEDMTEVAHRLVTSYTGARLQRSEGTTAPASLPSSGRVVNTWFEGEAPFPPLYVGQKYLFHFNIGAPRAETAGTTTSFAEPDFGSKDSIQLLVSLFSEDFTLATRQQVLILWRTGNTDILTTGVTARHAGSCRLEVVISLARELDVLQQLHIDVEVEPAHDMATAGATSPAPHA
jgi:hypothetical protein